MSQIATERLGELVNGIRNAQERACNSFLTIGAYLIEIKEHGLHRHWAGGITFDEFVEDIGLSRSTAYNCISVVKTFGAQNVTGIPMDRLVQLLPLKLESDAVSEWVEKARELPASGFRDEVREARGIPGEKPIDVCGHSRHKCADCGITLGDA